MLNVAFFVALWFSQCLNGCLCCHFFCPFISFYNYCQYWCFHSCSVSIVTIIRNNSIVDIEAQWVIRYLISWSDSHLHSILLYYSVCVVLNVVIQAVCMCPISIFPGSYDIDDNNLLYCDTTMRQCEFRTEKKCFAVTSIDKTI